MDKKFNEFIEKMEKDDKWILPLLFIAGVIIFTFFILAATGNLHYLFNIFGG